MVVDPVVVLVVPKSKVPVPVLVRLPDPEMVPF